MKGNRGLIRVVGKEKRKRGDIKLFIFLRERKIIFRGLIAKNHSRGLAH